ncbi:hypothetical protein SNE40_021436 [Patella caerulea]|uniref:Uncharacterized protein n=1 Tax=Patella caerulea TaxID=87958 RepID=A0AAN8IWN8_PATCE
MATVKEQVPTTTKLPPTTTKLPSTTTRIPSTTTRIPSTTTRIPPTTTWFRLYRRQPNQRQPNQENAGSVKASFQVIQCLHHLTIMEGQENGTPTRSFTWKIQDLNKFVKIAMKTLVIVTTIETMNLKWAKDVASSLSSHYLAMLAEKLKYLKSRHFAKGVVQEYSSHALVWAKKSHGKRLQDSVKTEFRLQLSTVAKIDTNPPPSPMNITQNLLRDTPKRNTPNKRKLYPPETTHALTFPPIVQLDHPVRPGLYLAHLLHRNAFVDCLSTK